MSVENFDGDGPSQSLSEPGLTYSQHDAACATVRLNADPHPPSDLWQQLVASNDFGRALVTAVREILAGVPHHNRAQRLREAGVTAADGGYARLLAGLERAPETDAHQAALDVTAQFGQGEVTSLGPSPALEAVSEGPLAALDAADVVPTIAVHIGEEFRDRRPTQREQTCVLLTALGQVCDVRVVASGLTARWLVETHGDLLPRSFSEQCKTGGEPDTPVDELVAAAREQFDSDGRAVNMLRTLADEPAETLSYHELAATAEVSRSRVSQVLSALEDAQLIEKYGPQSQRKVDLLPAGRELVDQFDAKIGRQQSLADLFSGSGNTGDSDVYSRPRGRGSGDSPPDQVGTADEHSPYHTRYLDRSPHTGAAAAGSVSDIVAVEGSLPSLGGDSDRHTRFVSFDSDRDEAVVAVRATTSIQYIVSLATGLASPRFLDQALPPARLESLDDSTTVLRQVRCIGALSNEAAADGETFRDQLVEWGEELEKLTTKLAYEEYEDREQLLIDILRDAHGLAGTIVHLLEAAGIDIVREVRVPSLSDSKLSQLARTVAISATIQSQYCAFAAYRQLFEHRTKKREAVPEPEVDAADPLGNLIGSIVLRGPGAKKLGWHVEGQLVDPLPLHEDAPEFAVEVTVATPDRAAATVAANRMLGQKNMRATPEAVSMLETLTEDLYGISEALHWLASEEEEPRTVRLDEIRYALSTLDADRLLADAPPSLSKAVGALLATDAPLTQSELADAADVSTRSLRRHIDGLLALDIVRETDAGYRIALPRPDNTERGERLLPTPLDSDEGVQMVAFDLVLALVDADEAGRLGDPNDPLGKPFFGPRLDCSPLRRALSRAEPYLQCARQLCGNRRTHEQTFAVGPTIQQTSLQESATDATVAATD